MTPTLDALVRQLRDAMATATPGLWQRFILGDRPIVDYLQKCVEAGCSDEFYFVGCQKPDGPADVCHVGNGPTSPGNARYIALCSPANMATLLDALTAAQEQGYTRVGHDDVSLLEDGCGLSIDMLDADRLRVWADKLAEHGPNVSHFASVTWMQGELARLSQAIAAQVRDVGRLRAALARRIAEGARLKEAAEEFARYHTLDCGAHFCRYCSARSPEWEHAEHCSFAMSQEAYTKLRAALAAEKSPRRSLNGEPEIEFRTLPIIKKEPPR